MEKTKKAFEFIGNAICDYAKMGLTALENGDKKEAERLQNLLCCLSNLENVLEISVKFGYDNIVDSVIECLEKDFSFEWWC